MTSALAAIRAALEAAGVEFVDENGDGAGGQAAGSCLTPEQCKAARKLLGLTQRKLAQAVGATQTVVSKFERTGYMSKPLYEQRDRFAELRRLLEAAGVVFTDGEEPVVKLRKAGK